MFTTYYEWYGAFAGLLMLCYNGRRGGGHKTFFYASPLIKWVGF